MALTRAAFETPGGFRLDLRCNEDTELFLRAGRQSCRRGAHLESPAAIAARALRRHRQLPRPHPM